MKTSNIILIGLGLLALGATTTTARAGGLSFSISFGVPHRPAVIYHPPVVVAPRVVCAPRAPVVYAPQPRVVYVRPAPVVCAPRPVFHPRVVVSHRPHYVVKHGQGHGYRGQGRHGGRGGRH